MLELQPQLLRSAKDFVSIWLQIEALKSSCGAGDDVLLDPLHLLAASSAGRPPCCCACWNGAALIGLLFANEQSLFGIGTGYAVGGDYSGRGLLICQPEDEALVLRTSAAALFAGGVHSLHLRMRPRVALPEWENTYTVKQMEGLIPGDRLELKSDYESLLGSLGKHTRRNIRYYTRKTVECGMAFTPLMPGGDYDTAVERLSAGSPFAPKQQHLDRDNRLMLLHGGGQWFALRDAEGLPVAVLCGFTVAGRFHLLTQLNDQAYEKLSLSLVLRGYLMEFLIELGYRELQFVGGASLVLGRFCEPVPYRSVYLDRRSGGLAAGKKLLASYCRQRARTGKAIPSNLEEMSGVWIDAERLHARTALLPASIIFPDQAPQAVAFAQQDLANVG